MGEEKKLNKKKNILFCVISVVILCVLLFPLFWILVTSLKTEQVIYTKKPFSFTLDAALVAILVCKVEKVSIFSKSIGVPVPVS